LATRALHSKLKESRANASNSMTNSIDARSFKDELPSLNLSKNKEPAIVGRINKNKYITSIDRDKIEAVEKAARTSNNLHDIVYQVVKPDSR
jgi:hypothetical protein